LEKFPEIPGYIIKKELKTGGMAKIYLAYDEKVERDVALKVLLKSLIDEELITQRFMNEARTIAKLKQPNIVSIFDVGQLGDIYYFAMEHLGESLKDKITSKVTNHFPPEEALIIVMHIANALVYTHEKGIIHRDIKPGNILFRKDGTPVLVDFGIAKTVDLHKRLTRTGISFGTPFYMSPEQIKGEDIDQRTDIYSLGILLYELLVGNVPYEGTSAITVSMKHLQEPIPRLPEYLNQYQELIDSMMAKEREKRIQNARELKAVIKRLIGQDKVIPTDPQTVILVEESKGKPEKKPAKYSFYWAIALVLEILLLGGFLMFLFYTDYFDKGNYMIIRTSEKQVGSKPETSSNKNPKKTSNNFIKYRDQAEKLLT
jgi:serine/threonine-protein kinase PpkA